MGCGKSKNAVGILEPRQETSKKHAHGTQSAFTARGARVHPSGSNLLPNYVEPGIDACLQTSRPSSRENTEGAAQTRKLLVSASTQTQGTIPCMHVEVQTSRPPSAQSETKSTSRQNEIKLSSRPTSTQSETKFRSRPPSVQSETTSISRPTSVQIETKLSSRPTSAQSDTKLSSRPTSAKSETKLSSKPTSAQNETKLSSRPTSAQNETKLSSRPTSAKSETKTLSRPTSVQSETKPSSRPTSVQRETNVVSRSILQSKSHSISPKQTQGTSPCKHVEVQTSRPPSAQSEAKSTSRPTSVQNETRSTSRPPSAQSEAKSTSRPASVQIVTKSTSMPTSEQTQGTVPCMHVEVQTSIPPSPQSETKHTSRPTSAQTQGIIPCKHVEIQTSRPTSAQSESKPTSRPASAQSESKPTSRSTSEQAQSIIPRKHVEVQTSRPISVQSESKPTSRPISVQSESKSTSRPTSVQNETKPTNRLTSVQSESKSTIMPTSAQSESKPTNKPTSEQTQSIIPCKHVEVQTLSRPISVQSETKSTSRPISAQSDSKPTSRTTSARSESEPTNRPTSAQSESKLTDRPTSAQSESKPTSRPTSAQSESKPTSRTTSARSESEPTNRPTSAQSESKLTDRPTSAQSESKPTSRPPSAQSESKPTDTHTPTDRGTPTEDVVDRNGDADHAVSVETQPRKKTDPKTLYKAIDDHAKKAPESLKQSADDLVNYLATPSKDPKMLVRAIFVWITENIRYDVDGYFGRAPRASCDAESVLIHGRSVCAGYAAVMELLCRKAKIPVKTISGYAKGVSFSAEKSITTSQRTNHAWSAVQLDGKWFLLDSTWGTGYVDANHESRKEFNDHYFLTDPSQLITSHFPYMDGDMEASMKWQLLKTPVTLKQFSKAIIYKKHAFKLNVKPISHTDGLIEMEQEVEMTFKSFGEEVEFSETLNHRDKTVLRPRSQNTFGMLGHRVYKIRVRPHTTGTFELDIFGTKAGEAGHLECLFQYVIKCRKTSKKVAEFPYAYSGVQAEKCILHEPLQYKLPAKSVVHFRLTSALLQTLMIHKTFLKKSGNVFEGDVKTGAGRSVMIIYGSRDSSRSGGLKGLFKFEVQ